MNSAIRRLLDELSWEGNATKYRNGGPGLENVLTAEVFQALDFLPRTDFLGEVLSAATGARARTVAAAASVETCAVDILPGDLVHPDIDVRAQPDVLIHSDSSYVFVEAKRVRTASFQPEQIARELLLAQHHAAGRQALLLLVLGSPPPVSVRGHGRRGIVEAATLGAELMSRRLGQDIAVPDPESTIAWITWQDIGLVVEKATAAYLGNKDESTAHAILRLASSACEAITAHS